MERTTDEQRFRLRVLGFVRVDGLVARFPQGNAGCRIHADPAQLGRWDHNNGKTVVVTLGGEVWLATAGGADARRLLAEVVASGLCPNGQGGAFVPCSNGEEIQTGHLLHRLADPDWQSPSG